MRLITLLTAAAAFAFSLSLGGCGKDANTKLCLDDVAQFEKLTTAKDEKAREIAIGAYQTCGISCDVTKDADACKAFKRLTEVICEKEGQDACKTLCEGSNNKKNESACALVKR